MVIIDSIKEKVYGSSIIKKDYEREPGYCVLQRKSVMIMDITAVAVIVLFITGVIFLLMRFNNTGTSAAVQQLPLQQAYKEPVNVEIPDNGPTDYHELEAVTETPASEFSSDCSEEESSEPENVMDLVSDESTDNSRLTAYKKVYKDILNKCITGEMEYYSDFEIMPFSDFDSDSKWFMLKDLNGDEIPELLLSVSYGESLISFHMANVYNSDGEYVGKINAFNDDKMLATYYEGGDWAGRISVLSYNGKSFDEVYYIDYDTEDEDMEIYHIRTNLNGQEEAFDENEEEWKITDKLEQEGLQGHEINGFVFNITEDDISNLLD